jgi:hypothetical protein
LSAAPFAFTVLTMSCRSRMLRARPSIHKPPVQFPDPQRRRGQDPRNRSAGM